MIRPQKRRRTKRNDPLVEDDVKALEAVTVERVTLDTAQGPSLQKVYIPILPPESNQSGSVLVGNNQIESTSKDLHAGSIGEEVGGMPDLDENMGKVRNMLNQW